MKELISLFTAILIAGGAALPARALDWNGKGATSELEAIGGKFGIRSGHPLANYRAIKLADERADQQTRQAFISVLGKDYLDQGGDAVQTLLFGGWLNEVQGTLDMGAEGGVGPMNWVRKYMGKRYRKYLNGRERSDRWDSGTTGSSANYLHSMMPTSSAEDNEFTQDRSYAVIQDYVFWSLTSSAMNLMVAQKGEADGSMTADDIDLAWIAGLRQLGSVFHITDDSAAACTPEAKQLVPSCVPGDGHTIVSMVDGRPQVTALSDHAFYQSRTKQHRLVDDLYREGQIAMIYGNFDSARANAGTMTEIITAVDIAVKGELANIPLFVTVNGRRENNSAFDDAAYRLSAEAARSAFSRYFGPRYTEKQTRMPLPPVPKK